MSVRIFSDEKILSVVSRQLKWLYDPFASRWLLPSRDRVEVAESRAEEERRVRHTAEAELEKLREVLKNLQISE